MVMTIPYINKIRVLSKISPPLAPPGPTSPVQNVRGAVIAVEGADYKLVAEVGNFILEYLSKEPECLVKTWPTSKENVTKSSALEAEMSGMDQSPSLDPSVTNSPYLAYLSTIQSWHQRSTEIKSFISATQSSSPSTSASASLYSPTISPTTIPTGPSANPPPPTTTTDASGPSILPQRPQLPIALLPTGFSLSLSDTYASAIPITDAYAPVDHWQWMATLWRGIVGPDLTVYVKALDTSAPGVAAAVAAGTAMGVTAAGGGGGGGIIGSDREVADELARYGGVECRWDVSAVVVRVGVGAPIQGNGGRVEEKTLRRLGFEVLEWIRNGMGSEGGRAGFGVK